MPFLDAKALDTDPEGMAFLRAVIRPDFEREDVSLPAPKRPRPVEAAAQAEAMPKPPIRAEAPEAVPVG